MTSFVILAALMVAAALSFVLPALWRTPPAAQDPATSASLAVLREQLDELDADLAAGRLDLASHLAARSDLERRTAEDVPSARTQRAAAPARLSGLMIIVAILGGAAGLYAVVGAPGALDPARLAAGPQSDQAAAHETNAMIERLARRLDSKPDDLDGWLMLARSYSTMGQHGKASAVFARLVTMHPDDAELIASYADTLAMANGKTLQGEPERLIMRALQIDARNVKANVLAGSAAFERGDYAGALQRWQKTLPLLAPGSEMATVVQGNIEEAGALAGGKPHAAAIAAGGSVQGTVELDPALRGRVAGTDTVFIFARSTASGAPRAPLAVLRKQVKDLPFAFTLDDSMGVVPGVTLSGFATVMVGARISSTGSANSKAGEPEALIGPVEIGARQLTVRIGAPAR
jgi:cytochrome c-type biogenesis protein CcmH